MKEVRKILEENELCVLCTESSGYPYCSLMTYILSEDGSILYLATPRRSRKYMNLQNNPRVSLLVDTRQEPEGSIISVTLEGSYHPPAQDDIEKIRGSFIQRHPELAEILSDPDCALLGIKLKTYLMLDGPVKSYKGVL